MLLRKETQSEVAIIEVAEKTLNNHLITDPTLEGEMIGTSTDLKNVIPPKIKVGKNTSFRDSETKAKQRWIILWVLFFQENVMKSSERYAYKISLMKKCLMCATSQKAPIGALFLNEKSWEL